MSAPPSIKVPGPELGKPRNGNYDRSEASDPVSRIVDAAIEAAPECVRKRIVLQSINWADVPASKVATMLASLEQARVPCPRWLSKALLVAGHVLSDALDQQLPPELKMLHRFNRATSGGDRDEQIAPLLQSLPVDAAIDEEVVGALVARLVGVGAELHAARLALAHVHRSYDGFHAAGTHVNALIGEMPSARLRLAGFSTTQIFTEALRPAFAAVGWRAELTECYFGEALSELVKAQDDRDALIVLLDLEGFAPIDWRHSAEHTGKLLDERADRLGKALTAFAERSGVPLLINTIPCVAAPTAGLLDRQHVTGIRRAIDRINARIIEVARQSAQVVVIDADEALSELPLARQIDPKLWFYGRIAYSADATRSLAHAFARAWRLWRRGPVKVLAIDLDNTLWGGIYGDDGVERLECGQEFPGNAFLAMQQECLRLRQQGILLAVLSKNNADALSAFERHPGMALRPEDFCATAVNWSPKPQNIRKIAADLNLGLDSFLFIDDSPQERDAMRRQCPEVLVPELPADPAERPLWLRRLTCTWPARLTDEDGARQAFYDVGRDAEKWRAKAATHEEFLSGLEQRLIVGHVRRETVARVAQMHQRTNQFNLTTIRSTDADIGIMASGNWPGVVLYGRVSDRFGDHGIVIAAVAAIEGDIAAIRSFLMSCRVIGREIERAFLGALLRELAQLGVRRVHGEYIPTAKNGMVRDFYRSNGFEQVGAQNGRSTWSLDLTGSELPQSQFVTTEWEG